MFEVGTVMAMAVAAVREDLCSRIMAEDNSKEKKSSGAEKSVSQADAACSGMCWPHFFHSSD